MVLESIERKITVYELNIITKKVLEKKGQIYIRQDIGKDLNKNPYFTFNIEVINCIYSLDTLHFQIQEGYPGVYIDIVFNILKEVKPPIFKSPEVDVKFIYNNNPDSCSYLLYFEGICISFNIEPIKFESILSDLKASVIIERQKEADYRKECYDAYDSLPEEFWDNIDA
ncbi:hypothetical protein [Clostridium lacusfryxellense]|uniref:hypothetical protein n=1 Tax=Clostridium lacusfryxellense TaxID=205328 RepID=UPI001C0AAFB9|nr:hypothetical protein [Clostridium lacusfryxellense]MBU3112695.1 hypothetical protein [Clostridium lacusfryxellense]